MDGAHGQIGLRVREAVMVALHNKYDDATQPIVVVNQFAIESVICR